MSELMDCHICEQIKASSQRELCPCCDYDGCMHADDAVEVLDWWVFSGSTLPLHEWFKTEVEKRAYRFGADPLESCQT
jgi:hypothetical protein